MPVTQWWRWLACFEHLFSIFCTMHAVSHLIPTETLWSGASLVHLSIHAFKKHLLGIYYGQILCNWGSSHEQAKSLHACVLSCFSHVWLFVTPWTTAHQAPLSLGFSRQEYWNGLLFPPPGDLPNPGIEPMSRSMSWIGRWALLWLVPPVTPFYRPGHQDSETVSHLGRVTAPLGWLWCQSLLCCEGLSPQVWEQC